MSITLFGGRYFFFNKSSNNINMKTVESLVITGKFFALTVVNVRRKKLQLIVTFLVNTALVAVQEGEQ
jgi:hypothetical protein